MGTKEGKECECCKRVFYESVMRVCPKKDGEHWICQYCCRRCKWQYKDAYTGWGCWAWDEKKASEGKTGGNDKTTES
jgi:hypothetical protein